MSGQIKIFIVEYDCVSLITFMLWLDQFPEFEVLGTTVDTGLLCDELSKVKPDVVLMDTTSPCLQDITRLQEIKGMVPSPAVLLLHEGTAENLMKGLVENSDGQFCMDAELASLKDVILNSYTKRLVLRPNGLPEALAG